MKILLQKIVDENKIDFAKCNFLISMFLYCVVV